MNPLPAFRHHLSLARDVMLLIFLITIGVTARSLPAETETSWERPETTQSRPAEDLRSAKSLVLLAPRYIYQDEATVRIVIGRDHANLIEAPRKLTFGGQDYPVRFEPVTERNDEGEEQIIVYEAEVQLDTSKMDDGEYAVHFELPHEAAEQDDQAINEAIPFQVQAAALRQSVRVIRAAFQKVAQQHQDELAVWLDDANANRAIWGKIPTWTNLPKALAQPDHPFNQLRGFVLRSYPNPQLRRRQPYTVYVPESLDLDAPAPLLILLHGSGGDHRNIIADEFAGQRFEKHPMLIANAGAYRNQEFRHLALNDVRWIIEDMQKKYNVDPRRVYLQGISLGGRGTLELAALMPDRFAALSPQGVYGVQLNHLDPVAAANRDKTTAGLMAKSDILTWLMNLSNTPTEIIYAHRDEATPPANALLIGEILDRSSTDATVVMRGFDTGHNISMPDYDWASTREWMLKHTLDPAPNTIRHRVSNLRFNTNRWLTVHGIHDYAHVGDVMVQYDLEHKTLQVLTNNVTALSLTPPGPVRQIITRSGRQRFEWSPENSRAIALFFDRNGRSLESLPEAMRGDQVKKSGRSGPIWDVWSEPVVYVWDDHNDEATTERLRDSVTASSRWDISWGDPFLPQSAASKLVDEAKESGNVILFTTNASTSPLLQETKINWPAVPGLAVDASPVRVMLRPSPWSDAHYLLIVETTVNQPISLHQFGWWDVGFQGDWIYAAPVMTRDGRMMRNLRVTAAGVFDTTWQPGSSTTSDPRTRGLLPHRRR